MARGKQTKQLDVRQGTTEVFDYVRGLKSNFTAQEKKSYSYLVSTIKERYDTEMKV